MPAPGGGGLRNFLGRLDRYVRQDDSPYIQLPGGTLVPLLNRAYVTEQFHLDAHTHDLDQEWVVLIARIAVVESTRALHKFLEASSWWRRGREGLRYPTEQHTIGDGS